MNDDLKQMLFALTKNAENQTRLMEQQSAMLEKHGRAIEEHGRRFDRLEGRVDAIERAKREVKQVRYEKQKPQDKNHELTIEYLTKVKWQRHRYSQKLKKQYNSVWSLERQGDKRGGRITYPFQLNSNGPYNDIWSYHKNLNIYTYDGRPIYTFEVIWNGLDGKWHLDGVCCSNGNQCKLTQLF